MSQPVPAPRDLRPQHRQALLAAGDVVRSIRPADLQRPSPCAEWDLGALVGHLIGQHRGFAVAVGAGDASEADYALVDVPADEMLQAWTASADRLTDAFAAATLAQEVRLVEISVDTTFTVAAAVSIQLLDTVVHTWDLATSLGRSYRPDDAVVDIVSASARRVPTGGTRTRPGAAFGPPTAVTDTDPWTTTLSLLGQSDPLLRSSPTA